MGAREGLENNGFLFRIGEDAILANQEGQKTEYLEQHLQTAGREQILAIYNKAVAERIFRTPVGLTYMKGLQERLVELGVDRGELAAIPVLSMCSHNLGQPPLPVRDRIVPSAREQKRKEKRRRLIFASVILNVALVLVVAAMLGLALTSKEPNILNYKAALENRYSGWEQELRERERVVRERERALGLENKGQSAAGKQE